MRRKRYTIFLFFAMVSCKPMLMMPDAVDAERAQSLNLDVTADELQVSHKLYINKCGSCHSLYLPSQYDKDKWSKVIPEMAGRAKLTSDEQKKILTYLIVMSEKKKVK